MKFLHVSTGDVRGAFAGAYRLHRNLMAAGHESLMLVADKHTADPTVLGAAKPFRFLSNWMVHLQNLLLKLACGRDTQVGHHFAFNLDLVPTRSLIRAVGAFRPDLVVVHYTSGFVSPSALQRLADALGAPMALYLMDMEMLTGGCHYAWTCPGYLSACESCPVVRPRILRHAIRYQWRRRRESIRRIDPVVVAGSGWLARQAAAAGMTRDLRRERILIGIDPVSHAPADKPVLRRQFGLPEQALVLYFGAQNLGDPRKGFRYLKAALVELASELTAAEREQVVLFTVGKLDQEIVGALPFQHVHRPYISDPGLFAATYAAADLFICPSVEDSGPMMINEAVVSGTPVAAFEMGVAVDLVQHGVSGFRLPLADARALAVALASFVRMGPQQRSAMERACRALGLEQSTAQGQVRAFVELAQSVRVGNARRADL